MITAYIHSYQSFTYDADTKRLDLYVYYDACDNMHCGAIISE